MISFFDLMEADLVPFIDELWFSFPSNFSLYIRGSSLIPIKPNSCKPIDIDFLLFTQGKNNEIKSIARKISSYAHQAYPLAPYLDIKVIDCTIETPELLFNTLLVTKTGKLLYGEDLSISIELFMDKQYEIILFSILEAESKLNSVIQTMDKKIQNKRVPHLSKTILRIAGLLRLKEGVYIRSPQDCSVVLYERFPRLINNIAIILNSFTNPTLTNDLLMSYYTVLKEIKQDVGVA